MIEVRDLTKAYGPYKAINHLNFSVAKGEVVGFLGPNGAGKTTTMKIITGFMAPSSGSVTVAGFDVFEDPIEVKRRIGYLPETPPVYGDMTVQDYLRFVANLKGAEKSQVTRMVDRAIEQTNLGDVRKRLIQNLSKGFRQRVGISGALVSEPDILILDEPTVGLDPRQVAEIRELIKELAGRHTIILSTHILPEVQASCQRIIIINRGHIAAQDSLEGLSKRMAGSGRVTLRVRRVPSDLLTQIRFFFGGQEAHAEQNQINQTEPSTHFSIETDGTEEAAEQIASHIVSKGAGLLEMKSETADLEDIFLQLTNSEEQQSRPSSDGRVSITGANV